MPQSQSRLLSFGKTEPVGLFAFYLRVALFALPLLVWQFVEFFILPIDFFTFRPWEALLVKSYPQSVFGPFYPGQHVVKYSIGSYDRSNKLPNPRLKFEDWYTDVNGYRNRPRSVPAEGYDVFVSGNSNMVGAFNAQSDIISETIERTCGLKTYSVAGAGAPIYFSDPAILRKPPRYFLTIVNMDPLPERIATALFYFDGYRVREPQTWPTGAMVLWDRLLKQPGYQWARSTLEVTELQRWVDWFASKRRNVQLQKEMSVERACDLIIEKVGQMAAKVRQAGGELVLLFSPEPLFDLYRPLIERLHKLGYKVVAWYPTPQWRNGVPVDYWHTEDSHWTEAAIRDAAGRVCAVINGGSGVEPGPVAQPATAR